MAKKIEVILLKQVPKLGVKNSIVSVSAGYARNYLLPQKLAIIATKQTQQKLKNLKEKEETERAKQRSLLEPILEKVKKEGLEFIVPVNENGQLFGSINENTIQKALREKYEITIIEKIEVEILIQEKNSIHQIGTYSGKVSFPQFDINLTVIFPITVKALKR